MYWQKRFDRENPDQEIEEKIIEIHKNIITTVIEGYVENFAIKVML